MGLGSIRKQGKHRVKVRIRTSSPQENMKQLTLQSPEAIIVPHQII